MTVLVLTILTVLVLNALFSAVEAAIFCTSYPRTQVLKRQKRVGAGALLAIRERMSRPVTTLVIGSNIMTIAGSLYIGHLATEVFGDEALGAITAIVTILVIVFGEIFPKVLGEKFSEPIALFAAPVLLVLTKVLSPIIWVIEKTTDRFTDHSRKIVSEEELKILSEIGSREGSIEPDEEELIRRVFTLNDMTAKDIMTPWKSTTVLKESDTLDSVAHELLERPYSRYPVVDEEHHVVGVCHANDLLIELAKGNGTGRISNFMMDPIFVPKEKRVDDLLALFLVRRRHMVVALDKRSLPAGVVTFEDVIEQLVGEIVDETDEVVDLQKGV